MRSVHQVSIKRDRNTGKNLGYGFVKMSSNEEAVAAKIAMHKYASL
jgi:RNA recognition motif-containing protein